jgi:replicative DNA helicase
LDRFQSQEAYALLEAALGEIRKERLVASKVENLFSLGPDVVAFYDRIKAGERGILTPWASFNDVTMGFWPEDLVLFAARTGVGKTWMALQLANAAWEAGHRVLFITTEMSKIRIASRFYAVHLHLPYKRLRLGQLGDFAESRFRQRIEALKEMKGIDLIGGQFDFHLDSVWSAIESAKPHIVFIDGVYLLRTSGGGESRTDKTAYIFDELKRMAKHFKVPFIVTTQFNRMATQGKTLSSALATEKLALTDVAGWNADLILGLAQTEDMKRDRRLMMLYLKIREGEGEGLELNWDFETMNFSEISKDREGAGDADEYGTGFAASPDALAKEDDLPF